MRQNASQASRQTHNYVLQTKQSNINPYFKEVNKVQTIQRIPHIVGNLRQGSIKVERQRELNKLQVLANLQVKFQQIESKIDKYKNNFI